MMENDANESSRVEAEVAVAVEARAACLPVFLIA